MKKFVPAYEGTLRRNTLEVPRCISECSGIRVFGRRIKSLVFSTDVATIKNINADAVIAVYPFTPQPSIMRAIISASDMPVFCGVGGAVTTGARSVHMAAFAEQHGAFGVVCNAAIDAETVRKIKANVEIPVIWTVVSACMDVAGPLAAGVDILNVSGAAETPDIVRALRRTYPDLPIIATGGPSDETITETIRAGANAITYTPPSNAELFAAIMEKYRREYRKQQL